MYAFLVCFKICWQVEAIGNIFFKLMYTMVNSRTSVDARNSRKLPFFTGACESTQIHISARSIQIVRCKLEPTLPLAYTNLRIIVDLLQLLEYLGTQYIGCLLECSCGFYSFLVKPIQQLSENHLEHCNQWFITCVLYSCIKCLGQVIQKYVAFTIYIKCMSQP